MLDGERVFEHYRRDVTPHAPEEVNSVTKSVVALLAGIAWDEGLLPSFNTSVRAFIPDARDDRVTLKHLLTMTSGWEWDAGAIDDCVLGACERFSAPEERLRFILSRPSRTIPAMPSSTIRTRFICFRTSSKTQRAARSRSTPIKSSSRRWVSASTHGSAMKPAIPSPRAVSRSARAIWRRSANSCACADVRTVRRSSARSSSTKPRHRTTQAARRWRPPTTAISGGSRRVTCSRRGYSGQFIFVARDGRTVAAATSDYKEASRHARELFEQHVLDPRA